MDQDLITLAQAARKIGRTAKTLREKKSRSNGLIFGIRPIVLDGRLYLPANFVELAQGLQTKRGWVRKHDEHGRFTSAKVAVAPKKKRAAKAKAATA